LQEKARQKLKKIVFVIIFVITVFCPVKQTKLDVSSCYRCGVNEVLVLLGC